MDWFYDAQVRRYLTQFMKIMSMFSYKDAKGELVRVPVRYGDMNRQVAQILKKNSENTIPTAPFIACYIKDIQYDQTRLQDPSFVGSMQIRERAFDPQTQRYLTVQGNGYTVEKLMPTPYNITFAADIWTTNTDQKLQIWEQIVVLFNPSVELQTTSNYIDWTSISVLKLASQTWSSRSIPQGVEQDIDILNMTFEAPAWITPPAKVKKMGIITKIITSAFSIANGTIASDFYDPNVLIDELGEPTFRTAITPGNFGLLVLNNTASLMSDYGDMSAIDISAMGVRNSWIKLLDLYPGQFRAGLSHLRLAKADGNEIVAYMTLDPLDDTKMNLNIDPDTIPANSTLSNGRSSVDAIINPLTFVPKNPTINTTYLILEDINTNTGYGTPDYDGPDAWKNLDGSDPQAKANDIISWDGQQWITVFSTTASTETVYITNSYTGIQYKWDGESWTKAFEGIYDKSLWRIVL